MIKKHILPIFFAIASSAVIPMAATGASFDELERKIEQLSEELNEVRQSQSDDAIDAQDEIETTNERLDYLTKISGYADVEYRDTNQSGTGPGFRLHHLSLFVTKRFNDRWRFFSEIEYEDAPKYEATSPSNIKAANGKIFVEAVNSWSGNQIIKVFDLPSRAPAKEIFSQKVLGMSAQEFDRFLSNKKITNSAINPLRAKRETSVVKAVAKNPDAIGYVSAKAAEGAPGIRVVLTVE